MGPTGENKVRNEERIYSTSKKPPLIMNNFSFISNFDFSC